jgi:hypothetical protein
MTYEEARHRVERWVAWGKYTGVQARRLKAEIQLLDRNSLPVLDWRQVEALARGSDWADRLAHRVRGRSYARALDATR